MRVNLDTNNVYTKKNKKIFNDPRYDTRARPGQYDFSAGSVFISANSPISCCLVTA